MLAVFAVFLWKNYKYAASGWKIITLQLLGFLTILSVYMSATNNVNIIPQIVYDFKSEELLKSYFTGEDDDFIFYTPSNKFLDDLMENVRLELSLSSERLISYDSVNETFLALEERKGSRSLAIYFEISESDPNPVDGIIYNISASYNRISTSKVYLNDEDVVGIKDYDTYIDSGFFILQRIIDKCYINLVTSTKDHPQILVEVAPMPFLGIESIDNSRVITFGVMFSFFFHILLLSTFLVPIVEEKQDGIKEFLALTTPYNYMNGITFYFTRFWILFLFMLLSLLVGCIWNGFGSITLCYVFLLFTLFINSAMCYSFLISVLFSSVFYAKVGGLILLLMPTALFTFELEILRPLAYLFSADTFLEGMSILQKFTNKHRNFELKSLTSNITELSYKMIEIYVLLIVQCFAYTGVYWYLSHLFPGKGGIRKPFYCIFQPSFYKKIKAYCNGEDPLHPEVAVRIRNLTKTMNNGWNKEKIIVDDLNMDIGCNRITVLLGHNGAGKTTTLNMITGCVERSAGEIRVCNLREVSVYRHLIGFCPQHNVFMQYLSCSEHLHFFARLRGLDKEEAEKITTDLLEKLHLKEKANVPGKKLSGGMKRRLSLGLAISGNTRVIILDEPSSGLDPESRREIWNILLELRKTQAILITTHHMEEAEILGDTVAILSTGKLLCSGSILELKRLYGSGYILKLLTSENFNQTKTLSIIKELIPTAKIKSLVYPTVCISLPYNYQDYYLKVLVELENLATDLGISSISITNTSLEDVFLNCESYDEHDSVQNKYERIAIPYKQLEDNRNNPTKNPQILANQGLAVFYKKAIFIKREWIFALFMFCIPLLSSIISMSIVSVQFDTVDSQPLKLNVEYLPYAHLYLKIPCNMEVLKNVILAEIEKANLKYSFFNESNNLEDELLKIQKGNLTYFYEYVMGALEVVDNEGDPVIKILHSGNIIHSSVIMLSLVDNVIFKYLSNSKGEIKAINVPSNRVTQISPTRLEYFNIIMPVGLLVYMIFYITLPFKEEKSEFKKLQFAPRIVYWLSFTIFDVLVHSIMCVFVFLIQTYITNKEVYNTDELVWLITTFLFYGISYLPLLYILASSFKSMSTLSACLLLMASISSITPLITSANLSAMDRYGTVISIMSILPDFSLNHQLRLISENFFITRRNDILRTHKTQQTPHINLTGIQTETLDTTVFFLYAVVVFVISEIFLIFVWDNVNRRHALCNIFTSKCFRTNSKLIPSVDDENDVCIEKQKVQDIVKTGLQKSDYPLIVRNLHKNYGKIHAVRGPHFAVKKGECFGLLGVNGAGKTSTFEMITANEKISDGEVYIDGVNIFENENLYKFSFGYCPQVDALIDFMTAYEILKYMALLRGIRIRNVHYEVMQWLTRLDLIKYKDVSIQNYSGGTKRKLSTAIAMIGSPAVLFLDEPTTGVDPISRRFMWKCIQDLQRENKTIVLTSHSMDECEHLCNRLAIMANGQFECLGFIPALKVKYGSGFTLSFRLDTDFMEEIPSALSAKMQRLFTCEFKEQHAGVVTYFVHEKNIVWSEVLSKVEAFFTENKNILKDYSINETTLEDIFLRFEGKNKNLESMCSVI